MALLRLVGPVMWIRLNSQTAGHVSKSEAKCSNPRQ